jgi:hypothetical protein
MDEQMVGASLGEIVEIALRLDDHQVHVERLLVALRKHETTTGPIVRFGTKRPSITSTWIQSAPAASAARTSSPSREKSADRIDGATMIGRAMRDLSQLIGRQARPLRHSIWSAPSGPALPAG